MAEEKNSETITIKKDTLWKYSTFVLLGILIIGAIVWILPGNSPTGRIVDQPGDTVPSATEQIEVDIEGDPVKGSADADITIVEFSDYECPFCARAFAQSLTTVNEYIADGKVKFVMKDYPLPFHPQAQKAAEAAHCARDQGGDEAYYQMHDALFTSGVEGGEPTFNQYAKDQGLNAAKFSACLSSGKFESEVKADLDYGSTVGVQGTPAFFINGRMISGACPDSTFAQALEAEEDGKDWGSANCQVAVA